MNFETDFHRFANEDALMSPCMGFSELTLLSLHNPQNLLGSAAKWTISFTSSGFTLQTHVHANRQTDFTYLEETGHGTSFDVLTGGPGKVSRTMGKCSAATLTVSRSDMGVRISKSAVEKRHGTGTAGTCFGSHS